MNRSIQRSSPPLSWKPIEKGKIYCSPGCGRGCTRAEYHTALREARALQRQCGRGWTIRVWENLGWHWELIHHSGVLSLKREHAVLGPDRFTCYAGTQLPGIDYMAHGPTPRSALRGVLPLIQTDFDKLQKMLFNANGTLIHLERRTRRDTPRPTRRTTRTQ